MASIYLCVRERHSLSSLKHERYIWYMNSIFSVQKELFIQGFQLSLYIEQHKGRILWENQSPFF